MHRDRIYIRKDILLKLYESGEMNLSKLLSVCGLNNVKHREILDDMVDKEFVERRIESKTTKYKISIKGIELLKQVFERYELLFPRGTKNEK